ncbi:hypothetical protein [Arthrobacter pityocampae]|uniref:hypothetical protein n=1 Tax=Arthrobacter pityocampae TaxID=547334 RepID=UPI0037368EC6
MISTKKWVAAGSTATLLAGGLFLGAPMASAAPGDAACLQASTQFNAALGLAGVDVSFVNQFELATAAVVEASANLEAVTVAALSSPAAVEAEGVLVQAEKDYETAVALVGTEQAEYATALAAAGGNVDDPAVVTAQGELTLALAAQAEVLNRVDAAATAYETAAYTLEVQTAEDAFADADDAAAALLAQLSGNEALAGELLGLFKAFLAACDASAIGVDPAPVAPAPVVPAGQGVTPVGPAPVAPVVVAPVAPGAVAAPTGTNKGLNVQTAVATEDNSAAVALIAALLAVGVAVPAVTAARMRRLERAQH